MFIRGTIVGMSDWRDYTNKRTGVTQPCITLHLSGHEDGIQGQAVQSVFALRSYFFEGFSPAIGDKVYLAYAPGFGGQARLEEIRLEG